MGTTNPYEECGCKDQYRYTDDCRGVFHCTDIHEGDNPGMTNIFFIISISPMSSQVFHFKAIFAAPWIVNTYKTQLISKYDFFAQETLKDVAGSAQRDSTWCKVMAPSHSTVKRTLKTMFAM